MCFLGTHKFDVNIMHRGGGGGNLQVVIRMPVLAIIMIRGGFLKNCNFLNGSTYIDGVIRNSSL